VAHAIFSARSNDYVVAAPVPSFQKAFFDEVQHVLVDRAHGGVSDAIGNLFESWTPLFCLGKLLDEQEDFLLAAGKVGCIHTFIMEKKRIMSRGFHFFLKNFLAPRKK
jgi:hypothetical protein